MKPRLICCVFALLVVVSLFAGHRAVRAADVELILGTSSAFNVVRGTNIAGGTSKFYVGSATVSVGTTTQGAMLTIAGSSTSNSDDSLRITDSSGTSILNIRNDGAVMVGTSSSGLNSALYVGSATSGGLGTITTGYLSVGTISANNSLHGTTTVRFLNEIFANGTITIGKSLKLDDGTITVGTDKFVVWNTGSVSATSVTATGEGTVTSGFLSVGTITSPYDVGGSKTVHFPGHIIAGSIEKGAGSFLIPHPGPNKNGMLLRHCFVESPTRGENLYRYKVEIRKDRGKKAIQLPSYWKHLNEKPQVWVTAVGQFASGYGYVDEESNRLVIRGEKKGKYNVLLVGTRKDKYAKEFFDAKGVEFKDPKRYELLTGGIEQDDDTMQLIKNTNNDTVKKKFIDPIANELGWAVCQ